MTDDLYLYLQKPEWAEAWVSGGVVPLRVASDFFSWERGGTGTPDETRMITATGDFSKYSHEQIGTMFALNGQAKITFTNSFIQGATGSTVPITGTYDIMPDDGAIMCLSIGRNYDWVAAGKKAVVKIINLDLLIDAVSKALGIECLHKKVDYTTGIDRNHFLKSYEDEWQKEYRLFWRGGRACDVTLPSGVAERVDI